MNHLIEELYRTYLKYPYVSTDSRNIEKNAIFFALKGEKFDGNTFALQVLKNGASVAVVDDPKLKNEKGCFFVPDVLTSLQELAKHHRSMLNIPFIGITGTNGKTTTKELINAVLSKKFNSFATQGNLNNHIGVPLSILSIRKEHEIAVIEMGANHPGEINMLCQIAQPSHGIITNIGKAHLEGFGSFEGVIRAKSELYNYLKKNKKHLVFINSDNRILMEQNKDLNIHTYGTHKADCFFTTVKANPFVELQWNDSFVKSTLIGKYNAENIMAAICIGNFFNVDPSLIIRAIEEYVPKNQRSELIQTKKNNIILDAYNANPSSMKQALENFKEMNQEEPLLILGDMFELGKYSLEEHKNIVELLNELNFSEAILIGENFHTAAEKNTSFTVFKNMDEAIEFLSMNPVSGKNILIKASRGMRLETLIPYL